jgi:uncharacterized integral membrane protein (TIGR00698 family)
MGPEMTSLTLAHRALFILLGVLCLTPLMSPALALVLGAALTLTLGNPYALKTKPLPHKLLALSIIGLGAAMNLRVVAKAGLQGLGVTATFLLVALGVGGLLGRLLRLSPRMGLLISAGTAICGGSAIAALVPVVQATDEEASVALGTVFLLNAVGLVLFPMVGHWLGLSQHAFGLWAAVAIHDTSSVVGAAMRYGQEALELATTVKLVRALWIVPLALGVGVWRAHRVPGAKGARPKLPLFILGFLASATLVTFVPGLQTVGTVVAGTARHVLVLTLFLIGANLSPKTLKSVGIRPLAMGVVLWGFVASASLYAIFQGWMG